MESCLWHRNLTGAAFTAAALGLFRLASLNHHTALNGWVLPTNQDLGFPELLGKVLLVGFRFIRIGEDQRTSTAWTT